MSNFPGEKRYGGVMFNVISITSGWAVVQFPEKKGYVTLEWPLNQYNNNNFSFTRIRSKTLFDYFDSVYS